MHLQIDRALLFRWHLAVILFFFIMHAIAIDMAIHHVFAAEQINSVFNLNEETNIPSFFSACALMVNGLLAWFAGLTAARDGSASPTTWRIIAALFLFLAIDEACEIHETFADKLPIPAHDIFLGPWVAVYAPVALVTAVLLLPFWWKHSAVVRVYFALGAAIYVGAAIGMEMVEAIITERLGSDVFDHSWIGLVSGVEECGEMLGVALLMQAILAYLTQRQAAFGIDFRASDLRRAIVPDIAAPVPRAPSANGAVATTTPGA